MIIQLTDPAIDEFDPDPAIQEWLKDSKRKRRPGFMDAKPKMIGVLRPLLYTR